MGLDCLSKGTDNFPIEFSFETKNPKIGKNRVPYWTKGKDYDHSFETTWDSLFAYLAPELISPTTEYRVVSRLNTYIESRNRKYFGKRYPDQKIEKVRIYSKPFDTIKIQLRALKLIVLEDGDHWVLSPYGDTYMTKLLAVHKA
jgi:hypothetical protein